MIVSLRNNEDTHEKCLQFYNRLQGNEKDKGGTLQRKKMKRKKAAQEQKKWLFKGRISTELMEIENLEDGTCM